MEKDNSLYTRLLIFTYGIENNRFLEAIKKGFLMVVPVLFLGAIALVIRSFPVQGVQHFLNTWDGGWIVTLLSGIYEATYGLLSIYLAISISLSLCRTYFPGKPYTQGFNVILAVICLAESLGIAQEGFTYQEFGNTGVFTAIVISILIPCLFNHIQKHIFGKEVKDFMISDDVDLSVFMGGVVPFVICLFLFFGINIMLYRLTGCRDLNKLFAAFFGLAFKSMETSLNSGLLFLFSSGLLWFLGIHGGNALELVAQNIFVPGNTDPNVIMSKSFLDVFGLMGGSGATLCMVIALLVFSRKKNHRNLAKVAIPTVLFNVNETMVFGLPVIFNPIMLIPFVLTPMVSVTIAYAAAYYGLMPIPSVMVEWTTPVLLSGYTLTGSVSGLIVQLIGIASGVAIYAPFIKMLEKMEQERDQFLIAELEHEYLNKLKAGEPFYFSKLSHSMQNMSVALASALKKDIQDQRITMYYQPQVDRSGKMRGVEALLRWDYHGRKILPPLVVALATENQMMNELSTVILRRSVADMEGQIRKNPGFKLSVNMTAEQINDPSYANELLHHAEELNCCRNLCIEITEEANLEMMKEIVDHMRILKGHGITFAMDDFSMGHTSLKYLKENIFDYVKLDGGLVKEIIENGRSEEIVHSIIQLGGRLHYKNVAEFVDDEKKKELLQNLGCDYYQGYLFSPAVPPEELPEE